MGSSGNFPRLRGYCAAREDNDSSFPMSAPARSELAWRSEGFSCDTVCVSDDSHLRYLECWCTDSRAAVEAWSLDLGDIPAKVQRDTSTWRSRIGFGDKIVPIRFRPHVMVQWHLKDEKCRENAYPCDLIWKIRQKIELQVRFARVIPWSFQPLETRSR